MKTLTHTAHLFVIGSLLAVTAFAGDEKPGKEKMEIMPKRDVGAEKNAIDRNIERDRARIDRDKANERLRDTTHEGRLKINEKVSVGGGVKDGTVSGNIRVSTP